MPPRLDPATRAAGERLVRQLDSAAAYNDKGYIWMSHTAAVSETLRETWRGEFREFAATLRDASLPPALMEALLSGAAAEDWTGDFAQAARSWLQRQAE